MNWQRMISSLLFVLLASVPLTASGQIGDDGEIRNYDDERVSAAVEMEFITQRGVPPSVEAEVTDGVVTLLGTADSILERRRAEAVAMRVKGVRGLINRITVATPSRPDIEIAADVEKSLARGPVADSWEVTPIVENGTVTLEGTVQSWQERQLSEMRALDVEGVRKVINEIQLDNTEERPDLELATEIRERLAWDVRVDDALIDVSVDDSEVELSGTVGSLYERNRAIADAWVTGVDGVDASDLEIKWWARDKMLRTSMYGKADEDVRRAVLATYLYDPRVELTEPNVAVDDGTVTLTGRVDNYTEKHAAEENARNVVGVWRVKNLLRVVPAVDIPDREIAGDLQAALIANPFTESFEIDFAVANGAVTLRGDVDSDLERSEAFREARNIPGVTTVYNALDVDPDVGFVATSDLDAATGPSDAELAGNIDDQLFWSPFVDEGQVNVAVDDGVATLRGDVDTWFERRKATENALEAGAMAVVNKLDVTYGPDLPGL